MRHIRGVVHVIIEVDVRALDTDTRLADEVALGLLALTLKRAVDRLPISMKLLETLALELRENPE